MMTERFRDNEKNAPYRRGVVTQREKGRVKVRFGDEDENESFWLSVTQKGSGKNKSWSMPNIGEQVACLMDWDGEDGCVIGSLFNDEDTAPTENADQEHSVDESGLEIIRDRTSGNITIKGFGAAVLEGGTLVIKADVAIEGANLTHNGKNVGHDHKHDDVMKGPDISGDPV